MLFTGSNVLHRNTKVISRRKFNTLEKYGGKKKTSLMLEIALSNFSFYVFLI